MHRNNEIKSRQASRDGFTVDIALVSESGLPKNYRKRYSLGNPSLKIIQTDEYPGDLTGLMVNF